MEVHRQTCQACSSHFVINLLVRKEGQPTAVYVRCRDCGDLVARYELREYYHHGKGLESYLRAKGGAQAGSGREWLSEFQRVQTEALVGYQEALEELRKDGKSL